MIQNKILIRNITNLTDARYFAAMEVDWISIRLSDDPATFARWHNLREWISGLKLAAEIATTDESLIAKSIIDANPDGIISDDPGIIHLTGGIELFVTSGNIIPGWKDDLFIQILPLELYKGSNSFPAQLSERIYLEAEWTLEMIEQIRSSKFGGGFSFPSIAESVNGMKDYSAMDEMIDVIKN